MKTITNLPIVIHKTYEKALMPDGSGKRQTTWYVLGAGDVKRLTEEKAGKFFASLPDTAIIRATAINPFDALLCELYSRGIQVKYAHWHDLGIPKSLPPEEIVGLFAIAGEKHFRDFAPRPDIAQLRSVLALRNSINQCYGDALRATKQTGRNLGYADDSDMEKDPHLKEAFDALKQIKKCVTWDDGVLPETAINRYAKAIPECQIFNEIAGLKDSYVTAASVVCYLGGLDRFPNVASVWHYAGAHVVEGKMPKRRKGSPVTWSPKLRTTLYLLGESLIKQTGGMTKIGSVRDRNPWRDYYEDALGQELAVHDVKCPNCKTKTGHSMARAKRKMVKEILKRFYLATKGIKFEEGHVHRETHEQTCSPQLTLA